MSLDLTNNEGRHDLRPLLSPVPPSCLDPSGARVPACLHDVFEL